MAPLKEDPNHGKTSIDAGISTLSTIADGQSLPAPRQRRHLTLGHLLEAAQDDDDKQRTVAKVAQSHWQTPIKTRELDQLGVGFITLRQRSPQLIQTLEALPPRAWTKTRLDRSGNHETATCHEQQDGPLNRGRDRSARRGGTARGRLSGRSRSCALGCVARCRSRQAA